ncbi:hypothetical protein RE474_04160 [Methanolobus sediminis]|uniref:Uncharacterized protein n=1 Tax=Methanolobus sediminis TaxID=3072978 RepID=A0AA51YME2_9EURY|nr:hypothetical protein [Methanolobus sediminis]WMW25919.1 hypothetical protein RE474_04160 [Methanolobus sediminis]
MSTDQVMLYYEKGMQAVEMQARVFWAVLGEALGEQEKMTEVKNADRPDLKRFYELYGNKIKRG